MQAWAVVLTDCVFWFMLFPFLAIKDYNINFFIINMHLINVVFLLGDTALNSLRFPWFRIAYFVLWTCVFVVFQWIVHACVALWWPYPFLDLSPLFSPLWYLSVAMMHIPCYGVAIPTISPDPYFDFRKFIQEMVEARDDLNDARTNWEYLHELLTCYLDLNPKSAHKFIVGAFADLLVTLMAADNGGCRSV